MSRSLTARKVAAGARVLGAALLGLAASGCGSNDASSDKALPLATYEISAPTCASTGKPPAYPAPNYRTALFDFADLTTHTWTVTKRGLVETYVDANCELRVERGIFENDGSTFSRRKNRHHVFSPADCDLAVMHAGETWPVSPAYTSLFTDEDSLDEDLAFDVTKADGTYLLRTASREDLDILWKAYGCAATDQIAWTLAPAG